MDIQDLYQELIVDHGMHPRNCCKLSDANHTAQGYNPLCGDEVIFYLKLENNIIKAISFEGKGCAISMATASMMTETLLGKTTNDIAHLFKIFNKMVTNDHSFLSLNNVEELGKMQALSGVKYFPMRVKCATLAWHTILAAIKDEYKIVCTEI